MSHESDNARTIHQVAAALLRQQARREKALHVRLQEAVGRAMLLSTISRASSEAGYTTSGVTEGKLPPGIGFDSDGELVNTSSQFSLRTYLAPIEHHVSRLEDAIDDEMGLGEARHHATKTGDELDEEILAWKGTPSHVVATKAPWLGSPRTIEKVRARQGLRPSDGTDRELRAA